MVSEIVFFILGFMAFGLILLLNEELEAFYKRRFKPLIDKILNTINIFVNKTYSVISNFFGRIVKLVKGY